MQELDPASFLFLPRDEYAPLHLDPALFESVGNGVTTETLAIPKQSSPPLSLSSSPADSMPGLKSLATLCDAYGQVDAKKDDGVDQPRLASKKGDTWESDWERELDERISHIERPNIFDSFHVPHNNYPCGVKENVGQTSSASEASVRGITVSASAQGQQRRSTTYTQWNSRSVFGSLSHPAGPSTLLRDATEDSKNTTEVEFELPALTKRPRDILDECVDRDRLVSLGPGHRRSEPNRISGEANKESKIAKSDKRPDSWRALGTPQQQDVSTARSQEPTDSNYKHGKPRLAWETCTSSGPKQQSDKPFVSPYITEAGTPYFEAVYERHTKDAFKFRPKDALISREKLVKGPAALELKDAALQACTTDTCINHSEEMGLIRIAFGRSLSSYLTFLQHVSQDASARFGFNFPAGPDLLTTIYEEVLKQPMTSDPLWGLDPFGEFFVESKHGWSWDGAEPIILGDPLDYTAEFRIRKSVKPAGFISERLAERIMEAGKELQILIEFEPRHPLIAHDRNSQLKSNGFKWLYAQSDIAM
ncbi:hypothetical protein BGZ70_001960 [Mortierella alpina]|uniref:Uncharacterized protein n=1 Tax=Mortierella alpina TaxID=64518 RepID=A0A9P6JBR0_MORAP|nr:hypothetical protein BGZ70_001960 [Mortierella alpina]